MGIQKTDKIWHNGKLINWDDATLHVMSHVVHYGSSVFEGIRCYELPTGPAIFRAVEHMQRLVDSAKVYRMDLPFTRDELVRAMVDTVAHNGAWPCYIRPVVLRGYGDAGVSPLHCPVEVYICNYPWGKYLSGDGDGVDVCVSSWTRLAIRNNGCLRKPKSRSGRRATSRVSGVIPVNQFAVVPDLVGLLDAHRTPYR